MISDKNLTQPASELLKGSGSPKDLESDPLTEYQKQTKMSSRDQQMMIQDNKKDNKIKRQNTGAAETSTGATLQESVLKMPIRYSLSSIREENKPERHFYTNLHSKNDQTRKETPPVDLSLDSDCLD